MLKALFIFLFTEPYCFSLFHLGERAKLTTSSVPKDWIQMDEVLRKFSVHNKIQAMVLKQQRVWSGFQRLATSQGWQTLISLFCSNMMFIELSGSFRVIAEQTIIQPCRREERSSCSPPCPSSLSLLTHTQTSCSQCTLPEDSAGLLLQHTH